MKLPIILAAFVAVALYASSASGSVLCVQQGLSDLGYTPGPADGAIGGRTRSAAADFAVDNSLSDLPDLSADTSLQWCEAIKRITGGTAVAGAKSVNGLFAWDFDVTSEPQGVLSPEAQLAYWDLHLNSRQCLEYRKEYGAALTHDLPRLPASAFAPVPQAVYPAAPVARLCRPRGRLTARLGAAIVDDLPPVPLDRLSQTEIDHYREVWGSHPGEERYDRAGFWFGSNWSAYRASRDPSLAAELTAALVSWAKAGALSDRVQIGGNRGPVIFAITNLMFNLVNAYTELAPQMSAEERQTVGPWLNAMMIKVASNSDEFRTQNHAAGWGTMIATWGLATGDQDAVQYAIESFKLAIHDMRPDGSFAADHSRGGNGLSYQNLITGDLVNTAMLLSTSIDVDLFGYEVEGRSIHTAVGYMLDAMDDPVTFNKRYALACPNGGDSPTTSVDNPALDFDLVDTFAISSYLPAYALMFPERDETPRIVERFPGGFTKAFFHPVLGAPPACAYALPLPEGLVQEQVEIETVQVAHLPQPDPLNIAARFSTEMGDAPGFVQFNITGNRIRDSDNFSALRIVIDTPSIGSSVPDALEACGSGPKADRFDDGEYRAMLTLQVKERELVAMQADCFIAALPGQTGSQIRFLTTHFDSLAKDFVASGAIATVSDPWLRSWFEAVALGDIILRKANAAELAEIEERRRVVTDFDTTELNAWTGPKDRDFDSQFVTRVKSTGEELRYNIIGTAAPTGEPIRLRFVLNAPDLGTKAPAGLVMCGNSQTSAKYDDGLYRLVLEMEEAGEVWTARRVECLLAAVDPKVAEAAALLVGQFGSIATSMVMAGEDDAVVNEGLRAMLNRIAEGTLVIE